MEKYNPHEIEAKWRARWPKERKSYEIQPGDDLAYVLDMFSYPSGEGLHMGHWRPYTLADVWSRYQTLLGKKVLHPVGFDSFGLPAENAAIKTGTPPAEYTQKSIANFKRQLQDLGVMYDWSTYVETSSLEYYKWTQWIFIQLYKAGLAYRKASLVNWCPNCQTVLANEQVISGRCERCDTEVTKRELKQWFLKITEFADDLLNFEGLHWPEKVKTLQTNWIGRSTGATVDFAVHDHDLTLSVFTTRVDTLYGVTYLVLAPENELVERLTTASQQVAVGEYVEQTKKKTEIERTAENKTKTGVFTGSYAIHPLTGESLPIWIADYVIGTYGTGAVMAVPAHDERDYAFAKAYDLPIKQVIEPVYIQSTEPGKVIEGQPFEDRDSIIAIVKHWHEDKYLALKWKKVAWGTFVTGGIEPGQTAEEAAKAEILQETGFKNVRFVRPLGMIHGKFYHVPKKVNRFVHAQALYLELENDEREAVTDEEGQIHDIHWLTEKELNDFLTPDTHHHALRAFNGNSVYTGPGIVVNSEQFNGQPTEEARKNISDYLAQKGLGGEHVQYRLRDWLVSRQRYWGAPIPILYCETCGEQAVNESDLPVLLPADAKFSPTGGSPLERHDSFKNVVCPKCGGSAIRETDTLDTFVDSSWYFLRYTDPKNTQAPFAPEQVKAWLPVDFYVGGTEHSILHLLYARFMMKALHKIGIVPYHEPFQTFYGNGMVYLNGKKMSKSKGNIVNPDDMVKQFGTDALRGYILFMGPADQDVEWQQNGIVGVSRFLSKAWDYFWSAPINREAHSELVHPAIQKAYKNVTQHLEAYEFNRCISDLMIAFNELGSATPQTGDAKVLCQLMAPFFPHFAEEIWERLGFDGSVFASHWPELARQEETEITYVIQVNGKVRGTLKTANESNQEKVVDEAKMIASVSAHITGKNIVKTIFVPGRTVNFVVE